MRWGYVLSHNCLHLQCYVTSGLRCFSGFKLDSCHSVRLCSCISVCTSIIIKFYGWLWYRSYHLRASVQVHLQHSYKSIPKQSLFPFIIPKQLKWRNINQINRCAWKRERNLSQSQLILGEGGVNPGQVDCYRRADTETTMLTPVCNLDLPVNLSCLDCGRKLEYPEGTHAWTHGENM